MRDVFLAVPEQLCTFFNNCFNVASIPDSWKYAKITPLAKGGNDQLVSNYRPILLLPLLSRLIEKIVHKRLYDHLTEYELGDRVVLDLDTLLLKHVLTLLNISIANNNNETAIAVFKDAMKAFDTVNHQILIKKL